MYTFNAKKTTASINLVKYETPNCSEKIVRYHIYYKMTHSPNQTFYSWYQIPFYTAYSFFVGVISIFCHHFGY